MQRVPVTRLRPGLRLAEDLFDPRAAHNMPLFARGLELDGRNIEQIQRLVSGAVLVSEDRGEPRAGAAGSNGQLDEQRLQQEAFGRDDVAVLFRDALSAMPAYVHTKARLRQYQLQATEVLGNLAENGELDHEQVLELGRRITSQMALGTAAFDPALLYLAQLEDWDEQQFDHAFDVGVLSALVASTVTPHFEEQMALFIAGLLHDVGKLLLGQREMSEMDYLTARAGVSSAQQLAAAKAHVEVAKQVRPWFDGLADRLRDHVHYGILQHHERFDGSGYPAGHSGRNISLAGRLVAICDVYDVLNRRRGFRTMIRAQSGVDVVVGLARKKLFDPALFAAFYRAVGRYPTGTVVVTDRGLAVVTRQNPRRADRPYLLFPGAMEEVSSAADAKLRISEVA